VSTDLIAAYAAYRDAARHCGDPKLVDRLWRDVLQLEKAAMDAREVAA
jgi:hypothetical protein